MSIGPEARLVPRMLQMSSQKNKLKRNASVPSHSTRPLQDRERLDACMSAYSNDPFRFENEIMLNRFASCCIERSRKTGSFLELGIGHGITLRRLSRYFSSVLVLEGSPKLARKYKKIYKNVEIQTARFESFDTPQRFDYIGMGFVLEHVDRPDILLKKYRGYLKREGSIFIGVPNAASLHRVLAVHAGMLKDIRQLSEADSKFGHQRYLTFDDWIGLFKKTGLRVVRAEGLYFKPFSTAQLESLRLDPSIHAALSDVAAGYPEISNTLFFEVKNGK